MCKMLFLSNWVRLWYSNVLIGFNCKPSNMGNLDTYNRLSLHMTRSLTCDIIHGLTYCSFDECNPLFRFVNLPHLPHHFRCEVLGTASSLFLGNYVKVVNFPPLTYRIVIPTFRCWPYSVRTDPCAAHSDCTCLRVASRTPLFAFYLPAQSTRSVTSITIDASR